MISVEERRRLRKAQRNEFIEWVDQQQQLDRRLDGLEKNIELARSKRMGPAERSIVLTQLERAYRATAADLAATRARVRSLASELDL